MSGGSAGSAGESSSPLEVTAGALTTINGGADIGEAISGYNFVRDGIFGSNQSAYDLYAGITAGIAAVGSAICGGWLRYNAPTPVNTLTTPRQKELQLHVPSGSVYITGLFPQYANRFSPLMSVGWI